MLSSHIRISPLTLSEVRSLPPLPSGYETDRVFRLTRREITGGMQWSLVEERLSRRIAKIYDDGEGAEWLESYADAGPPEALRFLGATRSGRVQGIATWTVTDWNDTLWLVDIRVRAENRGTGVGTALIGGLLDESRRTSLRGIFVETQIRNYPAVCFYRRRGFEISGFNDHLYTNHDLDEGDVALYLFREA